MNYNIYSNTMNNPWMEFKFKSFKQNHEPCSNLEEDEYILDTFY